MKKILWASVAICLFIIFVFTAPRIIYEKGTIRSDVYCIEDKERIVLQDATGSKYLIYTDKEVFENTDSLYNFKYSSSDVYNDLKIGKCYTLRVYGWRIPFFSWYRNIIDLEPIDTPDEQTGAPQVGETQKPVETLEQTSSGSTQQVQSEIITQEITETPSEAVTDEVTETPVVENGGDAPLEDKAQ